jgi:[protein-PII] uridylyltransferase
VDESIFEREPRTILEIFEVLQRHPELKGIGAATLRGWAIHPTHRCGFPSGLSNRSVSSACSGTARPYPCLETHEPIRRAGELSPPFGRIVGQMQHDLFHVYTVDAHILMVVRNLRRFAIAEMSHEYPLCSRLMSEFDKPELLYIAGLFHDIAKGRGGDHSKLGMADARRFAHNHGLSEEDTALVTWLVEYHLFMSATAQKKDLSDPQVIEDFARAVGSDRRLTALYLLTVADVRGTSPKVWNAWKGKLLEDLFWSTRRFFSGDTDPRGSRLQGRQKLALQKLRLYAVPEGAHEALWKQLDISYFLRHDAREIAWHTRLLNYRLDTKKPIVKAR